MRRTHIGFVPSEKRTHKEKICFLRVKCVCFGCLCIGHISKDCRKRITCAKCGFQHPGIIHIPPKEKEKNFRTLVKQKGNQWWQWTTPWCQVGTEGLVMRIVSFPLFPCKLSPSKAARSLPHMLS